MDYSPNLHWKFRKVFTPDFPDEIPKVTVYSLFSRNPGGSPELDPAKREIEYLDLVYGVNALLDEIERLQAKVSYRNIPTAQELLDISVDKDTVEKRVSLITQEAKAAALLGERSHLHFFSPSGPVPKPVVERLMELGYKITREEYDGKHFTYIEIEW